MLVLLMGGICDLQYSDVLMWHDVLNEFYEDL
jgi:hypothetical protein